MDERTVRVAGRQVRQLRKERGWSQEALAGKAGLAKKTIENIENDRYPGLLETVRRVAEGLEVDISDLLHPSEARSDSMIHDMAESSRSHAMITVMAESVSTGDLITLRISREETIQKLTEEVRKSLGFKTYLNNGSNTLFRIRWVLVNNDAEEDWKGLSNTEKHKARALIKAKEKLLASYNTRDTLSSLEICDDMVFRLYPIEEEDSSNSPGMIIPPVVLGQATTQFAQPTPQEPLARTARTAPPAASCVRLLARAMLFLTGTGVVMTLAMVGTVPWWTAQVNVTNMNCSPLFMPTVPLLGLAPIKTGASASLRVPVSQWAVEASSSQIALRGYGLKVVRPVPKSLRSLRWDGKELLGRKNSLKLVTGLIHTLDVHCR